MGITKSVAKILMKEGRQRPFSGEVLQLGRQFIHFTYEDLQRFAKDEAFVLTPIPAVGLHKVQALADKGYMSDDSFFQALGFSISETLDASDYEQSDHAFDLNLPEP